MRAVKGLLFTRAGLVLLGFLGIAGLLLVYEHRVHVFTGSGALIALVVLCAAMHFFMHGGHGGGEDHSVRDHDTSSGGQ